MPIDFTSLDRVIEVLQKKHIGGGSPPVVEQGHLGIWRNVRGHRMFLELEPGTGKWAVDVKGKPHVQGKVLVGPPSLVNQPIGGVDDAVWDKLSGSGTKRTFPSASPEGIKALKSSLRNSLQEDDTRRGAIDGTDELPKLVQIARSAGFTDDEIKASLGGKVFQNALSSNVVPFERKKPVAPEPVNAPEAPKGESNVRPLPEKDKPEAPTTPGKMTADGSLAPLLEALSQPASDGEDARLAAAEKMDEAADQLSEEFVKRQIRALAAGLRTGDFKLADVRTEVLALVEHRKARLLEAMDEDDMDRLADKDAAKTTVAKIKAHAANAPTTTPEQITSNAAFYHDQLMALSRRVSNPEDARQIVVLAKKIKSGRIGGNSVVLRVLAILRLLLAFIPGV